LGRTSHIIGGQHTVCSHLIKYTQLNYYAKQATWRVCVTSDDRACAMAHDRTNWELRVNCVSVLGVWSTGVTWNPICTRCTLSTQLVIASRWKPLRTQVL